MFTACFYKNVWKFADFTKFVMQNVKVLKTVNSTKKQKRDQSHEGAWL
jgi:hypothetical protein